MSGDFDDINEQEVTDLTDRLNRDAESSGYHLNPDMEFTRELVRGLAVNQKRYGYMACPCRLASGDRATDLDIICPCDYRDPDLNDFGCCYCALYVSRAVLDGKKAAGPIPERRPPEKKSGKGKPVSGIQPSGSLPYPVLRCRVCGYLCARESPPEVCPICKAKKDRFETFMS